MAIPFTAQLPRAIQVGDQVVIKGRLKANASRISFNFLLNEANVAMHFKTLFGADVPPESAVILNAKRDTWGPEEHHERIWQPDNQGYFQFTFYFKDRDILIYGGGNSLHYMFDHRLPYNRITRFEIWDDLESVQEVAFRYKEEQE